jgi:hypothetical protein
MDELADVEVRHLRDQIVVHNPLCNACLKLAAGFVCWPQRAGYDQCWQAKCHIHIPWHDADAVVVGIRHIDPDDDPAAAGHAADPLD